MSQLDNLTDDLLAELIADRDRLNFIEQEGVALGEGVSVGMGYLTSAYEFGPNSEYPTLRDAVDARRKPIDND